MKPDRIIFLFASKLERRAILGSKDPVGCETAIAGVGPQKAYQKTKDLLQQMSDKNNTVFINLGVCGACDSTLKVGALIDVNRVTAGRRELVQDGGKPAAGDVPHGAHAGAGREHGSDQAT